MEPTDEFRNFGKELPYQEPVDFLDQFSEKTLLQAKQREQSRKKSIIFWRTITVAASLSALALLGYFMLGPEKPVNNPVVLEQQPAEKPAIEGQGMVNQTEIITETKKAVPEKVKDKTVAEESNGEEIGDVLADLTDEELMQLAAIYQADLFISESEQ